MATSATAWKVIQGLADQQEPKVRRAYLQAIEKLRRGIDIVKLATAIERGDIVAVNRAFTFAQMSKELREVAEVIRRLTQEAMRVEALRIARDLELRSSFQLRNPLAIANAERHAGELITRVSADTRLMVRQIIVAGQRDGLSPQAMAKQIRDVVGLHPRQSRAVARLRREMRAKGLGADVIHARAQRYADRLLRQRAKTIARTETIRASNAGQQAIWEQAQRQGLLPIGARKVWIVTPDDRLCPVCASIRGETVAINQPFSLGVMAPPAHPNCLLGDALIAPSGRITAVSERPFDGDVLIIGTASGKRLATTPNHPILTPRGWVPARALHVTSDVISQRYERVVASDDDGQHVPTRIHEIAEAFGRSGQVSVAEVPVSAEDFHGDGFGGEIAIVRTDGALMGDDDVAIAQQVGKDAFEWADVELLALDGLGVGEFAGVALSAPSDCGVCGSDLSAPFVGRHLSPLQRFGLALGSGRNALLEKPSPDAVSVYAEQPGEGEFRTAGEIFADQVIDVDVFSAHQITVFNVETPRGWYVANGIVNHNCRCAMRLKAATATQARGVAREVAA